MNTTTYSVQIPCKPYIARYVAAIEGSPVLFKSNSMLCQIIRAYMENRSYSGWSQKDLQTSINCRTAKIEVLVPLYRMPRIGSEVNPHSVMFINHFLEDCFIRALNKFMKDYVKGNGRYKGYKDAYYAFAELYKLDLETDITFEGLKRMDYRHRKREEKSDKINFSQPVPSLDLR